MANPFRTRVARLISTAVKLALGLGAAATTVASESLGDIEYGSLLAGADGVGVVDALPCFSAAISADVRLRIFKIDGRGMLTMRGGTAALLELQIPGGLEAVPQMLG